MKIDKEIISFEHMDGFLFRLHELLNMRQLYGMDALNKTRKHFKRSKKEAARLVTGLTRSVRGAFNM